MPRIFRPEAMGLASIIAANRRAGSIGPFEPIFDRNRVVMAVAVTSKPKRPAPSAKARPEPMLLSSLCAMPSARGKLFLPLPKSNSPTRGLPARVSTSLPSRPAANKRMLYYYFGSKEDLYLAVLERAYGAMRQTERELNLTNLEPLEAIKTLVEFKFDYCQKHPTDHRAACRREHA